MGTYKYKDAMTTPPNGLAALNWQVAHRPEIAPGTREAERGDFGQADDFIGK